jgi:hypothetical protein
MPVLGFAVTALYLPGIPSATTSPRWWMIFVGAFALLAFRGWQGERFVLTRGHVLGAVCLALSLLSLAWSVSPLDTLAAWLQLLSLGVVFLLAAETPREEMDLVWIAMALGLSLSAAVSALQLAGYGLVQTATPIPTGLFLNKNTMAEIAAMVLVALLAQRRWAPAHLGLTSTMAFCALAPASRGAALALCLAGSVALLRRVPRWRAVGVALCLALGAAAFLAWDAGDARRWGSMEARLDIWLLTLMNMTWLGHGYGSYGAIFGFEYAHNEALHALFEMGVLALPFFGFLWWMGGELVPERFVFLVAVAIAAVSFPLHIPATAFAAVLALGHLCGAGARACKSQPVGGAPHR